VKQFEVILSEPAINYILNIYKWIYEISHNAITAQKFTDRLTASCGKIGNAPYGGKPRDDLMVVLRTVPFEKRTIIAYIVVNDVVEITNVFYGGRDYEALFE
jgi:toxin ParE1/3/4